MLEEKITNLKKNLVEFAGLIENMLDWSIKGLTQKDRELLNEVIKNLEPKANHFEIAIEEMCINIIAQYAPKGKDLRIILMVLEMNKDMERAGDHTVNIAQSGLYLIEKPLVKQFIDLPKMTEITKQMFSESINSFVNENTHLAKSVCEKDELVDNLGESILKEAISLMSSDSSTVETDLHFIRISHNLERISDISTNISENVIYLTAGKVIKHHIQNSENSDFD
ncbi:MAG: phosphate signaling complex protein PhoU [Elusimicrobiota bacterium]